jgi:hypothetical protein
MPSFEEICVKVFRDDRFALKALVGGALGFVPVVNLLVFGYFVSAARSIRETGQLGLPDWEDAIKRWERLAMDGLVFFIVSGIVFLFILSAGMGMYFAQRLVLPIFSGFRLLSVADAVLQSASGLLAYLPYALALLLTPAIATAALSVHLRTGEFQDYLRLDLIFRALQGGWQRLVLPSFAFMGLMLLGTPLFGFAFFLGFAPILTYTTIVFLILENEENAL